jgi:hypothetical protein
VSNSSIVYAPRADDVLLTCLKLLMTHTAHMSRLRLPLARLLSTCCTISLPARSCGMSGSLRWKSTVMASAEEPDPDAHSVPAPISVPPHLDRAFERIADAVVQCCERPGAFRDALKDLCGNPSRLYASCMHACFLLVGVCVCVMGAGSPCFVLLPCLTAHKPLLAHVCVSWAP